MYIGKKLLILFVSSIINIYRKKILVLLKQCNKRYILLFINLFLFYVVVFFVYSELKIFLLFFLILFLIILLFMPINNKRVVAFFLNKNQKINIFSITIIAGFVFAVCYHYAKAQYFGIPYPQNTFLFTPIDKFADFSNVVLRWNQYLPGQPSPYQNYFPFTYIIVKIFIFIKPIMISLITFWGIFLAFFISFSSKYLKSSSFLDTIKNVIIFTFCTYPVLFVIDRGNFEIFIFIFLGIFLLLYKKKMLLLASVFLSFAICMKAYPIVFVILFISDKKYKAIIYTVVSSLLISVLSLLMLYGGVFENITRLFLNLKLFTENYAINLSIIDHGHSFYGFIRLLNTAFHWQIDVKSLLGNYFFAAIFFFLLISLYIIFVEKKLWKKTALLVFSMCCLPHVSFNYKLIHLFFPIYLYINANYKENDTEYYDIPYVLLFSLLLIPKNYNIFVKGVYSGMIIDPLLMLAIMSLIIFDGILTITNKPLLIKVFGEGK